jgi:putative membrane protein
VTSTADGSTGGSPAGDPASGGSGSASDGAPPEKEPDYRFTLANERTFLAWIRTSLALLAAAVALGRLVPDLGSDAVRKAASLTLAVLAMVTAASSVLRWRRVQIAVDRDEPIPRSVVTWVLAGVLLLLAAGVAIALITSRAES